MKRWHNKCHHFVGTLINAAAIPLRKKNKISRKRFEAIFSRPRPTPVIFEAEDDNVILCMKSQIKSENVTNHNKNARFFIGYAILIAQSTFVTSD